MAMHSHQEPAAKLTRLQTASMLGRLKGAARCLRSLLRGLLTTMRSLPSFCCPITQVSKALGHVLLKHDLAILLHPQGFSASCLFSTSKHADGRLDRLLRVYLCAAGADAEPCGCC